MTDVVIIKNPYAIAMASANAIGEHIREKVEYAKMLEGNHDQISLMRSRSSREDRIKETISNIFEAHNSKLTADYLAIAKAIMMFSALEAFINLVLEIFLKDEFSADLYTRKIYRDDVNLRLLYLNVHCSCFDKVPFQPNDEIFKAVQYALLLRNNLVHANFPHGEVKRKYDLPTHIEELQFSHCEIIQDIIRKVVICAIRAMKEEYKHMFLIKHCHMCISFKKDDGVVKLGADEEDRQILRTDLTSRYLGMNVDPRETHVPSFPEYLGSCFSS